jgi:hypothetical protein
MGVILPRGGRQLSAREYALLDEIAEFYGDPSKAGMILRWYARRGNMLTPDGKIPLTEFYRTQKQAWERRRASRVDDSIEILERCFSSLETRRHSFFGGTSGPYDLDNIEDHRDFDG